MGGRGRIGGDFDDLVSLGREVGGAIYKTCSMAAVPDKTKKKKKM